MKIGIFIPGLSPDSGGSFTFEDNIYNALKNIESSEHTFYLFHYNEVTKKDKDNFIYVQLNNPEKQDSSANEPALPPADEADKNDNENNKQRLVSSLTTSVKKWKSELFFKGKSFIRKVFIGDYIFEQKSFLNEQRKFISDQRDFIEEQRRLSTENQAIIRRITTFVNYDNVLNKAALDNKIDLMWFLVPSYFEPVQVPYFFTMWDLAHRIHPYFPEVNFSGFDWESREQLYNVTLQKSVFIFTGTEAGKKEISELYKLPEDKINILPFPSPSFDKENLPDHGNSILKREGISSPYLLYPAQFWPHKNHMTLLRAAVILRDTYDLHFNLVFTGSDKGNKKYIEKEVKELHLIEKVFFAGFIPMSDLIYLYQNAFALVFPSFFGPDNIPPLEAFALSCPVIASRVSGAQEQLGDAALLFDPKKEEEIAEAVKKLTDEPDLRNHLIKKGLSRVNRWSSDDYVKKVISHIDEFKTIRRCWSSTEPYSSFGS